jgi:threonine/homoserine/homoserine lactone efflux protein
MAIGPILTEMLGNLVWILLTALGLGSLALVLPLNPNRLAKA